jgi:dephospho-CoA kinase
MDQRTRHQSRSRRAETRTRGPWKHGAVPVIGLIGGIGAGKSQVAALLAGRGAQVLDADAIGHALLDQRPVRDPVIARFGPTILAPPAGPDDPPVIDRRALASIVFARPEALAALEAIVHPRMRRTFERAIARAQRQQKARAVVLDAAILMEKGWNTLCDSVVYVDAPRPIRLERLARQRGWTEETLRAREAAQWPPEKKRALADAVISNDAGPDELNARVDQFWTSIPAAPRGNAPAPTTARRRG